MIQANSGPKYKDGNGNVYRVEQASNRMWVVVRINPGGNRKGYKACPAMRQHEAQNRALHAHGERMGWVSIGDPNSSRKGQGVQQ